MNRRFFCAGLVALNTPYLASAQSTTKLEGYIPLGWRNIGGELVHFIRTRFQEETSGEASLSFQLLGQATHSSSLQNTRETNIDFEIAFDENGFRNPVAASHLFSSLSITTPGEAKKWYESGIAQEVCEEISVVEEVKVSIAGNCMEVGLGYYRNVLGNLLPNNTNVSDTSPIVLTNFGWSKVWRRLGVQPIVMAPIEYYNSVTDDVIGVQYASIKSAEYSGGQELFDFLYTNKTINTAPIQLLATKSSMATDLHKALQKSIRLASQDMLSYNQSKRDETIQRLKENGRTIIMNDISEDVVGKIMSAWEITKGEDSESDELAAKIIASQF